MARHSRLNSSINVKSFRDRLDHGDGGGQYQAPVELGSVSEKGAQPPERGCVAGIGVVGASTAGT